MERQRGRMDRDDHGAYVADGRGFEFGFDQEASGKLCQPSSNWVPISNQMKIRQPKLRDGLCLSYGVPLRPLGYGIHLPLYSVVKYIFSFHIKVQGPVVQSIVSLTSFLRGKLVKCFTPS